VRGGQYILVLVSGPWDTCVVPVTPCLLYLFSRCPLLPLTLSASLCFSCYACDGHRPLGHLRGDLLSILLLVCLLRLPCLYYLSCLALASFCLHLPLFAYFCFGPACLLVYLPARLLPVCRLSAACLSIYLPTCLLSVCLSALLIVMMTQWLMASALAYLLVSLSICLSVYLSICPSVHLSICPSACLTICLRV
jgi:hypothetical protein